MWKSILKWLLEDEGIETKTRKEALKQAYVAEWLQDEKIWLQMLRDRNETSHVYSEEKAKDIYENIMDYYPEMLHTFLFLKQKYLGDGNESSDD
ncbi:HI0074 family nucleotidyltransferase substrate-binding subunit [Lederbergia sp. NSJ-179]|uniref:HI0074 family nucleotidyltransferase substrate-binding subunit n=1 Tax=Lederbergia sp. NSJ-179 TaxID=2931402 RepID=UPI001FD556E6|nr:HI0074 family nucleotidyltransferase substrate-binding subunit [Lederbergia sp. NSJ-179]MCJ7840031.1 HI0074 family nucleotidyltransferase substrate-binding subunit [Lederbergia sp. NSJ-179]